MNLERSSNGHKQLALVSEAEMRAAALSFGLLNRSVAEGKYRLEGSWFRRIKDEPRIGVLNQQSSNHYSANSFFGLLVSQSDEVIHNAHPLEVTGDRDLGLLKSASRLLLDREVAGQEEHARQGRTDWASGEKHAYGPAFMPALRAIVAILENPSEQIAAHTTLSSLSR